WTCTIPPEPARRESPRLHTAAWFRQLRHLDRHAFLPEHHAVAKRKANSWLRLFTTNFCPFFSDAISTSVHMSMRGDYADVWGADYVAESNVVDPAYPAICASSCGAIRGRRDTSSPSLAADTASRLCSREVRRSSVPPARTRRFATSISRSPSRSTGLKIAASRYVRRRTSTTCATSSSGENGTVRMSFTPRSKASCFDHEQRRAAQTLILRAILLQGR